MTRDFICLGTSHHEFHLVDWDKVTIHQNIKGCSNVKRAREANIYTSMLDKIVSSMWHDRNKLWVQIMSHETSSYFWRQCNIMDSSYIGNSIKKTVLFLHYEYNFRIGARDFNFAILIGIVWVHDTLLKFRDVYLG